MSRTTFTTLHSGSAIHFVSSALRLAIWPCLFLFFILCMPGREALSQAALGEGLIEDGSPVWSSRPVLLGRVGEAYRYSLIAEDPDREALHYELVSGPEGMVLQEGLLHWLPAEVGSFWVLLRVEDTGGLSALQSFELVIEPDEAGTASPVWTSRPVLLGHVGEAYRYPLIAEDPDREALHYELVSGPEGMVLQEGLLHWLPAEVGRFSVLLRVEDTGGLSALQSFELVIEPGDSEVSAGPSDETADETAEDGDMAESGPSDEAAEDEDITESGSSDETVEDETVAEAVPFGDIGEGSPSAPPALSSTAVTRLHDGVAFLYSGDQAVQTGVEPGTIEVLRVAVLRGRVLSVEESSEEGEEAGGTVLSPLSGVTVSILGHGEYGETESGEDGWFNLVVNGGGMLTLVYEKSGYLPVQRKLSPLWQDYSLAEDVVMLNLDESVSEIDLSSDTVQVALGSEEADADGARQGLMLFRPGTEARVTLSDGSEQSLDTLSIRMTEYTASGAGARALPGELPSASGYTYAVELSADEALALGARRVDFSQPVSFYVDNFLDFPVGEVVPVGYYDYERSAWIGSDNGRVIGLLEADEAGQLGIDITGTGEAATAEELSELGIDEVERLKLAELYRDGGSGQSLWWVAVEHLTPWDLNWPFGPPPDAEAPPAEEPYNPDDELPPDEDECEQTGCSVFAQSQVLGERLDLVGVPWPLHYRSEQMAGRGTENGLDIPVSGETVPASVRTIEVTISLAGRRITEQFPPEPNQSHRFIWDGLDAYGRLVNHAVAAEVTVSYRYAIHYYAARSDLTRSFGRFGASGGGGGSSSSGVLRFIGQRGAETLSLQRRWRKVLRAGLVDRRELGGWRLAAHHRYDPLGRRLHQGDGAVRDAAAMGYLVIGTVAGGGQLWGDASSGGPATAANLSLPGGLAITPDGTLYIADGGNHRVRRVDPDGRISTVAGGGSSSVEGLGDGGPATAAYLGFPRGLALGADGSLYIASGSHHRVRRVDPDGVISTVAGTGEQGYAGDDGPATAAHLNFPWGLTIGADGVLYISDYWGHRVRRVDPDGVITTVAGGGRDYRDGVPATAASLYYPRGLALGADGSLYIADRGNNRIRQVGPDGVITTVAGTGVSGYLGDGGPATAANLSLPGGLAITPDGTLYIADSVNNRIRRVGPDGIIRTVAGGGEWGYLGDGGPATAASLYYPQSLALGADGSLYVADTDNHRVRRVSSELPGVAVGDVVLAASDGRRLYHFNAEGRHLATLDALTGAEQLRFSYTAAGYLQAISDADGQQTTIERDETGVALAIVGPAGQRTSLSQDANGYLSAVTDPSGSRIRFSYDAGGLLTSRQDAEGNQNQFSYDALGRLIEDEDPVGGGWLLNREENSVSLESGEGRIRRYSFERLADGSHRLVNTGADGGVNKLETSTSGSRQLERSNGMVSVSELAPDPRFGMQSAYVGRLTLSSPGGLRYVREQDRQVESLDAQDPLNFTALQEDVTVNGVQRLSRRYDAATRVWRSETAEGRWSEAGLDGQGRLIRSQTEGLSARCYQYDTAGRLARLTTACSPVEDTDDDANTGTGTDDPPRTHHLAYHDSGGGAGYLSRITDALGREMGFAYDAAGRLSEQTLLDGRSIQYRYDNNGELLSLTTPAGTVHDFSYTGRGLPSEYNPPPLSAVPWGETRYHYNLDRELIQVARADGGELRLDYNDKAQLTTLRLITTADSAEASEADDMPVAGESGPDTEATETDTPETDSPATASTEADTGTEADTSTDGTADSDSGADTEADPPEMATTEQSYHYRYDADTGQLTDIEAPHGITLSYRYDGGLPLGLDWRWEETAADDDTSTELSGQVSNRYRPLDAEAGEPATSALHILGRTVNNSPEVVFSYDRDGLLTGAGDLRLTRSTEHGLITETVLSAGGSQLRTSYRYNSHGERLALTVNHEGGDGDAAQEDEDQLYHTRYTRDALGRITGTQEQGQDTSYHYDTAGRLDKVTVGTDETRYRYDDNSNRTHIDNEEVARYDAQDRLLSYQDCDYHYTAYGDLQTRTCGTDISHYRYDLLGNLLSVAQGGQTIDYLVDGEGRRIGRRVDGVLESAYLYKDALNPVARLDNRGRISQRYIYASLGHVPDYLIAYTYSDEDTTEAASSETYKLIVDQLGSVQQVVRVSDGEVLQSMTYDAWGEVTQDSNPGFQPFGYAGGLYDPDTGLVRFGARDYDAETGRWTSKDPLLFDGGDTNLYGYVLNDPINFIDVWGLIRYNAPPPRTVPVTGKTERALKCLESCLQRNTNNPRLDLLVTGGAEKKGHSKKSHHYKGEACDIAGPKFNPVKDKDVKSCAAGCGFGAGYFEKFPNNPNRDHWHLQLSPGNGVPPLNKL